MNRKKKLPVVTLADRDEAAGVVTGLPAEATIALEDVAGAIRDGLLAFSCSAGRLVMQQTVSEEMMAKVGPKGRHDPDRVATRNGSAPGSVALGGRVVPVRRPRATLTGSGELRLASYAVFSSTDLLTQLALERMLAGVATRRHGDVAEPIGAELEATARSESRSAISRRFKAATETALAELLARDLATLDVAVLMIDGIVFAEVCCVVALIVAADGTKVPVGLWDGDTENGTVVTDLLADLVARGLRYEDGLLVVIDGAKALATGVKRVFGNRALVQRCVLHKRRNCASTATAQLAEVPRTATYTRDYDSKPGFMTVVSDGDVLGAYALGPEAGEWLQQATVAIRARVPLEVMNDVIQPFPLSRRSSCTRSPSWARMCRRRLRT